MCNSVHRYCVYECVCVYVTDAALPSHSIGAALSLACPVCKPARLANCATGVCVCVH
jgi:hypothetical protein